MPKDEVEFEKTLEGLSEEEQSSKRLEFKASKSDDYREKLNIQNRILEKEGFEFKEGKWEKKPAEPQPVVNNLSPIDSVLLAKSVDAEDIQEVLDFAAYRKVSVADALKNNTLVSILKERKEERATAQATNTRAPSRTSPQQTADTLLQSATQGQVPDEPEAIAALAAARIESKSKK